MSRRTSANARPDAQSEPPSPSRSRTSSALRPRTSDGLASKARDKGDRYSLQDFGDACKVPPLPEIPSRFLENNKPATVNTSRQRAPSLHVQRPSTATSRHIFDDATVRRFHSPSLSDRNASRSPDGRRGSLPTLKAREAARLALEGRTPDMDSRRKGAGEDLFLEVARDREQSGTEDEVRELTLREKARSRAAKRRSLPADFMRASQERRSRTGATPLTASPQEAAFSSRLQQHAIRYGASRTGTPSVASQNPMVDDAVSMSGPSRIGRANQYTLPTDRTPMSPSRLRERVGSPELPQFGRRRPSFGAPSPKGQRFRLSQLAKQDMHSDSPGDSSEPKQSNGETDSAVSQTAASTVWDELDDLKSRIKKLELTGKLPQTSGAAVSGSIERPRTATTAPTTIDSSPKHERKPDQPAQSPNTPEEGPAASHTASIHPLLHAALAKAKPLLNPSLYRSLEATAADALQLAAMTGSAGPQGTAFSAASIINGVTVSDRHIRRKADTMCRNLTDLCLALCDGKHEVPAITTSPMPVERAVKSTPPARRTRASLGPGLMVSKADLRPASRLDARRTSMGLQPLLNVSSHESNEDVSASEQESINANTYSEEPMQVPRPGSRLLTIRQQTYGDISGDDEPTVRPLSRAVTDVGRLRKSSLPRVYSSAGQERSPAPREPLSSRRANVAVYEGNQTLSRISSLSTEVNRRRFIDRSTPPVLEEGSAEAEYQSHHQQQQQQSQPRRHIASLGRNSARRATEPGQRAMSLQQRRDVLVE